MADSLLKLSIAEKDDLTGKSDRVKGLKKQKETSIALENTRKNKEERTLEQLRRKRIAEADRILMLQEAAAEMENIIARLEKETKKVQPMKPGERPGTGVSFATLKGHLTAPCRGKIIVPFGTQVDPITNLKSFSPGDHD